MGIILQRKLATHNKWVKTATSVYSKFSELCFYQLFELGYSWESTHKNK